MAQFELIFAVDPLSDETIDRVYESFDALAAGHGSATLLTVTVDGPTALMAAKAAVSRLESIPDVVVQRCYEDLVDRADIAERCETTPQAVGQWVRHVRHRENPFPEPFNHVGGGVWLWGEVNAWLKRLGKVHDALHFPCLNDYLEINRWLAIHRAGARMTAVTVRWDADRDAESRQIGGGGEPGSLEPHWSHMPVEIPLSEWTAVGVDAVADVEEAEE